MEGKELDWKLNGEWVTKEREIVGLKQKLFYGDGSMNNFTILSLYKEKDKSCQKKHILKREGYNRIGATMTKEKLNLASPFIG